MPDITMCKNNKCKNKEECYRYKAIPTPNWQSYFVDDPSDGKTTCDYFWELKRNKKEKRED